MSIPSTDSGQSHVFKIRGFSHGTVSCLSSAPPPPKTLNSSWTEDTRSCIFSDTALHLGKDGRKPLAAELDMQIEQKFKEFEELVTTGKKLLDKDHHLTQMVGSRVSFGELDVCLFFCTNPEVFPAGERAHGGAEEHAGLDHRTLEGSETTVASQEEQRRGHAGQHLFHHVPGDRGKPAESPGPLTCFGLISPVLPRLQLQRSRTSRPNSRRFSSQTRPSPTQQETAGRHICRPKRPGSGRRSRQRTGTRS